MVTRTIIITSDGSKTIHIPEMDEHYHSVNGALTESLHVFIKNGYQYSTAPEPVVFETGFGTGLNCWLTALQAEKEGRKTTYIAVEKFPLKSEEITQLSYGELFGGETKQFFDQIHAAPWNTTVGISEYFSLRKLPIDFHELNFKTIPLFDVIYHDAFGPDKQPDLWTPEIFEKLYRNSMPGAVFVTYSAKGEVRRRLSAAGFTMERLQGPPGKKEMLRGIKNSSII